MPWACLHSYMKINANSYDVLKYEMDGFTNRKVTLEGLGSSISVVAANLASVTDVEPVKLVQPVWDRLPYPTQSLT